MKRPRRLPQPRAAESRYVTALIDVWRIAQQIIAAGVTPLVEVWPKPAGQTAAAAPLVLADAVPPALRAAVIPRPRTAAAMTDAELRQVWPGFDPGEIRDWAPWATSRAQAARIAPGLPATEAAQDAFLRQSIAAARAAAPLDDIRLFPHATGVRTPESFIPVRQPPTIIGPDGIPIPPPPRPRQVTVETIRQQISWCELQIGHLVRSEQVAGAIDAAATATDRASRAAMEQVLGIDIRSEVPQVARALDVWRGLNIDLIESGVMGTAEPVRLRPGLLRSVSELVEEAHTSGLRVEALAGRMMDRYGVSASRAELIARDQILKLNGQINQARQESVGVRRYRWATSRDERVRRYHARLNGRIFEWAAPPVVSANGRREHPGQDYQCRCQAIPIIDDD